MNVPLANATKENHKNTQKNHYYRNSVLVKIMFSVILARKNVYGSDCNMYKAWIVIVTCSRSRTLYLDVENSLSASCANTLKRFINQYGATKQVLSGNGSVFTSKEVEEFISLHGIKWSYNIAEAPWTGGFFESMERSAKRCLKKILGQARVRFNELLTILKKIENVCNRRQLT